MITLSEKDYINEGTFQKCYIHPENKNLCIKVKINAQSKNLRVDREVAYYKKIQKKKIQKKFWAIYHGKVITNYGTGHVYDLIRDETTNEISKTVSDYLEMDQCPIPLNILEVKFQELKHQMIKHKIIARDITGRNVCCKMRNDNSMELIIIDGVGHKDFIPLVDYIKFFTKMKMNKVYRKKQLNSMDQHKKWLIQTP